MTTHARLGREQVRFEEVADHEGAWLRITLIGPLDGHDLFVAKVIRRQLEEAPEATEVEWYGWPAFVARNVDAEFVAKQLELHVWAGIEIMLPESWPWKLFGPFLTRARGYPGALVCYVAHARKGVP